jgi:hypothetical protein
MQAETAAVGHRQALHTTPPHPASAPHSSPATLCLRVESIVSPSGASAGHGVDRFEIERPRSRRYAFCARVVFAISRKSETRQHTSALPRVQRAEVHLPLGMGCIVQFSPRRRWGAPQSPLQGRSERATPCPATRPDPASASPAWHGVHRSFSRQPAAQCRTPHLRPSASICGSPPVPAGHGVHRSNCTPHPRAPPPCLPRPRLL